MKAKATVLGGLARSARDMGLEREREREEEVGSCTWTLRRWDRVGMEMVR